MRYILAFIFLFTPTLAQAETLKCRVKSIVGSDESGVAESPAGADLNFTGKIGDTFLFNTKTAEIEGAPLMAKFIGDEDSEQYSGAKKDPSKRLYYYPHTDGHVWTFKVVADGKSLSFQNYDTWTGHFISGSCEPAL